MDWKAIRDKVVTTALSAAMLAILGTAVGSVWSGYRNQQKMINDAVDKERSRVDAVVQVLSSRIAELEGNVQSLRSDLAGHCVHETNWFMSDWNTEGRTKEITQEIILQQHKK